jgi:aldehyde:ferredoxin oxidoreductase
MLSSDPLRRVLVVDLSKRTHEVIERPDLFEESLGGAGAAIRLLEEYCPQDAEPLGPENPIIFAVGPLVGLYPLASKTVAMFKSPHTGNLGESHAGGRSAVSLRMAGYGAVVLVGRSPSPTALVIDGDHVAFRDASALWGLRSSYTAGSVLRERESGSGHRSILRIGPAGERQVSYAGVITETYRHFGRLGLGAVFGSKRLKGVVIVGKRSLATSDPAVYRREYEALFRAATQSSAMRKYHELGTPMNVLPLNELGALPVRNLQASRYEGAAAVSGEALAEGYLGRRLACSHCPVACIHLAALRTPHPDEPYFYKTSMLGYDYEPIYALGSLLGFTEVEGMMKLIDEVEIQGLDAMTSGVVLAWATEAFERNLIGLDDLDGVRLRWGDAAAYTEALRRIVRQPTDLYRALARGVEEAASVYGGAEFALAHGGNEMPGYHTGPVGHLGFLIGARHSHLDNAGYSIDQKELEHAQLPSPAEAVARLVAEESWRQVLTSLVVCLFSRGLYTPETITRTLSTVGFKLDEEALRRIGSETLHRKWAFKRREGFTPGTLRVVSRILDTPSPWGKIDPEWMRSALQEFETLQDSLPA